MNDISIDKYDNFSILVIESNEYLSNVLYVFSCSGTLSIELIASF